MFSFKTITKETSSKVNSDKGPNKARLVSAPTAPTDATAENMEEVMLMHGCVSQSVNKSYLRGLKPMTQ